MKIEIIGELSDAEEKAYISELKKRHEDKKIANVRMTVYDEYVDIEYTYDDMPFERIRRITGYLVGSLDRFNDAKRAEESQRVKHDMGGI